MPVTGSAVVIVNPTTEVSIVDLKKSYNVDADPVPLLANVSGGTFSGKGSLGASLVFRSA